MTVQLHEELRTNPSEQLPHMHVYHNGEQTDQTVFTVSSNHLSEIPSTLAHLPAIARGGILNDAAKRPTLCSPSCCSHQTLRILAR